MNYYCIVILFVFLVAASKKKPSTTINVHEKVNLLKKNIQEEIAHQMAVSRNNIQSEERLITPIIDSTRTIQLSPSTNASLKTAPNSKVKREYFKPRGPYRREFGKPDVPIEWLHCQDLITPFFQGHKTEVTVPRHLTIQDHAVYRFLQLIQLNTTGLVRDEIYSILNQINSLQIRLFQWDVSAVALLLQTFAGGKNKPCNFKKITYGVKSLLRKWHLDISNTTNQLKQARIFRPPCVRVSDYEGSTKTSRGKTFPKMTSPKYT